MFQSYKFIDCCGGAWSVTGGAERAVGAAAGPVACAAGRPVAGSAGLVADAAGPITEDAEPLDGVRDNASKLSQTGQRVPLQGHIIGFTNSRMLS